MNVTPISTTINSAEYKAFYAYPSGRAKVLIDNQFPVQGLLDNGSEVLMMSLRVFDHLDLPIDTKISWRINTYNSEMNEVLESAESIGVCHNVSLDVGGVMVKLSIFVVRHSNADLILGRPWERAVRAQYINEDDGSYTMIIKSPDERRVVEFCAVKGEHERNREHIRHAEERTVGQDPLKV